MNKNLKCSVFKCKRPLYAKGYCNTHWAANRRYGSPFGKYPQETKKFHDTSALAYQLAQSILTDQKIITVGGICQFCVTALPEHSPSCVVNLAQQILDILDEKKTTD